MANKKEALSHWKLILWDFHTKNKNKHAQSYIFKQLKLTIKNVYKFQLAWLSFFFIYYTSRALLLSHAILPDLCVQKHYWKEQLTLMFHSVFYNRFLVKAIIVKEAFKYIYRKVFISILHNINSAKSLYFTEYQHFHRRVWCISTIKSYYHGSYFCNSNIYLTPCIMLKNGKTYFKNLVVLT